VWFLVGGFAFAEWFEEEFDVEAWRRHEGLFEERGCWFACVCFVKLLEMGMRWLESYWGMGRGCFEE
jgi:hypothetical protein